MGLYNMDSHSVVGQDCPESMSDTNHCPVSKFPLNGELNLTIRFKVNRGTVTQSINQVMAEVANALTWLRLDK